MDNKIDMKDVMESLTNQVKDYAVRLSHAEAMNAKKDKCIKELELENKQLREGGGKPKEKETNAE